MFLSEKKFGCQKKLKKDRKMKWATTFIMIKRFRELFNEMKMIMMEKCIADKFGPK